MPTRLSSSSSSSSFQMVTSTITTMAMVLLALLTNCAVTVEAVFHSSYGIAVPTFRYVPFAEVPADSAVLAEAVLKYEDKTWDSPGTAGIEFLDFSSLEDDEMEAFAYIGFGEDWLQYDCAVNHFGNYDWEELNDPLLPTGGFQSFFEVLGWTKESWNGDIDPPASDDEYFADLSPEQQVAAGELCYFAEIWDMEEAIGDWDVAFPDPSTDLPTGMPTGMPTAMPTEASDMPSDSPSSPPTNMG